MKVGKNCPYCMNEAFTLSGMQTIVFTIEQQQLVDSGVHPVKCPKGHEFAVIFKGAKFEVLFDLALNAIKDGYSREAVSSFASSLERFYEFFIRFCGHSNGLNMEAFDKVWKNVSNQSERQLGAYLFMYINKYDEEPVILSPKMVKFRNSVIHKGYIPNLKEALDFGEAVHTLIMKVIARLEVCEDNKLSNFYQTVLPQGKGYKWTVDESPLAICLNKKYKTPDIPKATSCTEFAVILKKFGINGL